MNLRIQQGRLRGRRIPAPPEIKGQAHFTSAQLKETVFQILDNRIEPASTAFFDLCAGSGQMGFEALSRGYARVVLGEVDPGRIALLRKTAGEFSEPGQGGDIVVLKRDLRRMAGPLLEAGRAVVFLDPPYSFWEGARCPPVESFLESFGRKHEGRGRYLFLLQGPECLTASGNHIPKPETRRQGNHGLSIFDFDP